MSMQYCYDKNAGFRYTGEDAKEILRRTGIAVYIIYLIENDINTLFDPIDDKWDSVQYKQSYHRIDTWFVKNDINISEKGFYIYINISDNSSLGRSFKIIYAYGEWIVEGMHHVEYIMNLFVGECYRNAFTIFNKPDPDTKIYKSIYGEAEN